LDNPASCSHVETFHPDLTTVQRAQAERLIAAAWVRLKVIPGLRIVSRMEAGTLDPDVVASVIGEMVANVLRNPEGARSRNTTMTIDDYTETNQVTIDHARAEGLLYPTDGMLAMLRENRRGAWTVIPS
jgi:hypothetical protein